MGGGGGLGGRPVTVSGPEGAGVAEVPRHRRAEKLASTLVGASFRTAQPHSLL